MAYEASLIPSEVKKKIDTDTSRTLFTSYIYARFPTFSGHEMTALFKINALMAQETCAAKLFLKFR